MAHFSILIFTLVACAHALAQDLTLTRSQKLGDLQISDLYIQPQYKFEEPQQGSLELSDSFLGVRWRLDKGISSTVQIGSASSLNKPFFYGENSSQNVVLIAGFGQLDFDYGTFRAGLIPLTYGLEGGTHPANLNLPYSRIYSERWIAKYDMGISYEISHQGFKVELQGHNGETAANRDNQTWMTGRWQYQMEDRFRAGFSGTSGRTTPDSTGSTATNPDFDFNSPSRVSIGNAFVAGKVNPKILLAAEYHLGSVEQNKISKPVQGWHFDAKWQALEQWALLARFENFTRNTLSAQGGSNDSTLGVAFLSPSHNYDVYLTGTRIDNEGAKYPIHQALLVWKLAPLY